MNQLEMFDKPSSEPDLVHVVWAPLGGSFKWKTEAQAKACVAFLRGEINHREFNIALGM